MDGEIALISLGSNVPNVHDVPASSVLFGSLRLRALFGDAVIESRLFRTPAFPPGIGPDFVNAAVAVRTTRDPDAILSDLHEIERLAARERSVRWGPRTLDLDLLAVGDRILPDRETQQLWRDMPADDQRQRWPDRLILPHPRLQDRAFVLVPLAEVAPTWVHPVLGLTVVQMRDVLPAATLAGIVPLDGVDRTG